VSAEAEQSSVCGRRSRPENHSGLEGVPLLKLPVGPPPPDAAMVMRPPPSVIERPLPAGADRLRFSDL
jgi:hypothetical protein